MWHYLIESLMWSMVGLAAGYWVGRTERHLRSDHQRSLGSDHQQGRTL